MKQIYSIWLYGKTLFFIILFFPIMLVIAIIFPSLLYKYACFLSKGIFWSLNIKREVVGKFPDHGPYILMHNHSSFLDLFFYLQLLRENIPALSLQKILRFH